ncbi:hypothetical protein BASA61_007939 [Batrachochytrium salamandrivorans]|nr:hypothetical protein BASA61_007939 [Batrachochytrium salamandrivorans]
MILTAKPEDTRNTEKVIGEYVEGDSQGLRRYPYTTDMDVNPLTYQNVVGEEDPHRLGAIWATMLWEVYWNFVDAHGFSANLHDATQKEGNIIFLQLLVGTLMIQPCDPTFISARDAMLATDMHTIMVCTNTLSSKDLPNVVLVPYQWTNMDNVVNRSILALKLESRTEFKRLNE